FTGGPDQTGSGGSYSTQPGYGPNTRTMMQIVVRNTAPAAAFNPAALAAALPLAYGASQPNPIVPAVAYNAAFGTNDTDVYAHVATGSAAQPTLDFSTALNGGVTLTRLTLVTSGGLVGGAGNPIPGSGTGYDPLKPPVVVFNNTVNGVSCLPLDVAGVPIPPAASASATAVVDPGTLLVPSTRQVTGIINFKPGSGYTCAPTVTFTNPPGTSGVGAQVTVQSTNMSKLNVFTKAEQELFDNRGRYNSTGGVELPLTNGIVQTTVPLNYMDSATEFIGDGEVQVWKLVDNGLWTNSMHFNMVDVQLINRVGWDGTVKAPSSNEVGWKDTLRLNPLEDVIVAMRAKRPQVPFGQPKSSRLLDPSKPVGTGNAPAVPVVNPPQYASGLGFTVAAGLGTTISTTNKLTDFDNEFAWGSAMTSHAENDLTRPIVYRPTVAAPGAPTALALSANGLALTWVDPTPAGQLAAPLAVPALAATLANPTNEIGFIVKRALVTVDALGNPVVGPFASVAMPANVTSFTDPALLTLSTYQYTVTAWNAAGATESGSMTINVNFPPPTGLVATPVSAVDATGFYPDQMTLTWKNNAPVGTLYEVWRGTGAVAPTLLATLGGALGTGPQTWTDSTVIDGLTYTYQIKATAVAPIVAPPATSNSATAKAPAIFIAPPTPFTAAVNATGTLVTLSWVDRANNETAYQVEESLNGGAWTALPALVRTAAQTTSVGAAVTQTRIVTPGVLPGNQYAYRVTAQAKPNDSAVVPAATIVDLSAPVAPATPVVTKGLQTGTRATFTWLAVVGATSYVVQTSTNGGAFVRAPQTTTLAANPVIAAGNSYVFQVLAQTTKYGFTTQGVASAPLAVITPPAASTLPTAAAAGLLAGSGITVKWTNPSSNISGWNVQRRIGAAAPVTVPVAVTAGALGAYSFTDTTAVPGTSYTYHVQAVSTGGISAYSGYTTPAVKAP
ncbi:MAG: hypothetical protein WCH35_03835, partial [Comamonadaceae bacterium]